MKLSYASLVTDLAAQAIMARGLAVQYKKGGHDPEATIAYHHRWLTLDSVLLDWLDEHRRAAYREAAETFVQQVLDGELSPAWKTFAAHARARELAEAIEARAQVLETEKRETFLALARATEALKNDDKREAR